MKTFKFDWFLIFATIVGLLFCLYGSNWGRVECLNPDQMALRPIFKEGKLPFQPEDYQKPPFHTYLNFFLAEIPARMSRKLLGLPYSYTYYFILFFSRLLSTFLFLVALFLIYLITKTMFSIYEARTIAFIFASSAGIISFAHFLTADIPVLFWMLFAFYFCQKILFAPRTVYYFVAGFLTGIATATKYNGLAVGIALVVAHLLSQEIKSLNLKSLKTVFINKKIIFGLLMIPVGFIIVNPYSILDYSTFIADFLYNYNVTPIYEGLSTGNSYISFFLRFTELVGLPLSLIIILSFFIMVHKICFEKGLSIQKKQTILTLSVLLLYYFKFGAFPRMETRFVLPIMPYVLIISAFFCERIKSKRILFLCVTMSLFTYNIFCSFYVGNRFSSDPRMKAQLWVIKNVPSGSKILSSPYVPDFTKLCGIDLKQKTLPFVSGRNKLFKKQFANNTVINNYVDHIEQEDKIDFFSLQKLNESKPDFISIDSLYYDRFLCDESGYLYPNIREFFANILYGEYPYTIVFDEKTKGVPIWIYPQNIDFLNNRILILRHTENKA